MDNLIQSGIDYVRNFDWNSPEAFGAAAMIAAVLFQRWMILFTVIVIMVIGANIEKVFVFEYEFNQFTVTSPFVVYLIGFVVVFAMAFLSLFNR
ncbi:hypothetical protein ACFL5H_00460 [Candidatus Latescibacterota bacterium]